MSSQKTEHYELNQWLATDQVLRTDFNADNAKIDAALNTLAGQVSGKADGEAFQALSGTVAEHTAAIAQLGNCQIYTTSYVGTGTFTYQNRTQLTFPATPRAVFITGSGDIFLAFCPGTRAQLLFSDETASCGNLLWTETSLSFYDASAARNQMNHKGRTYQVVALLDAGA